MKSQIMSKVAYRNNRSSSKNKREKSHQCYIHDNARDVEQDVRNKVCVKQTDYRLTQFEDGHYYCLFHLPTREKDVDKFEKIFQSRLTDIESVIIKNERLVKDNQKPTEISYNFNFVWFPSKVNFHAYNFNADVFFRNATFSKGAEFGIANFHHRVQFCNSTFIGRAIFADAIFCDGVYFLETTFSSETHFSRAEFRDDADFSASKFSSNAYLREAKFSANTTFHQAEFSADVYFSKALFCQNSSVDFSHSKFTKDIFFEDTKFCGKTNFNSVVFGKESDVFFRRTYFEHEPDFAYVTSESYLSFTGVNFGKNFAFNLQHTAFDKASRILFKSVKLRPNWFVNADPRKFVFHDVDWMLDKNIRQVISDELAQLKRRQIEKNPIRLLKATSRQLAENAENNNRFDEASNFRQMAFECESLEIKEKQTQWWMKRFSLRQVVTESLTHCIEAPFDLPHFLYRWLSGYGEKWFRAFCWLLFIWIGFALSYYTLGEFGTFGKKEHLEFGSSFSYSFLVMILQKPEPRPFSTFTSILYGLETVLAPIQAALLALAIRRKFMR